MRISHLFISFIIFPICLAVGELKCSPPPLIREARLIGPRQESYTIGTVLQYHCNAGYDRVENNEDNNVARCVNNNENGAIWHFSIQCQPVNCGDPGEIENGRRIGDQWTHPNSVEYVCNEGHIMNSNESPFLRHCQSNRMWSNFLPSCSVINCSVPENPEHGSSMFQAVTYGSKVYYDCGLTRRLQGDSERECQKNGQWSGRTPICVEFECDYPILNYPEGKVRMLAGTRPNDRIIFECNNGTILIATCFSQGVWLPSPPSCLFGSSTNPQQESTTTSPIISTTTPNPKKKNFFCRWKLLKWMCKLLS